MQAVGQLKVSDAFQSILTDTEIADQGYKNAQTVGSAFEMNTFWGLP